MLFLFLLIVFPMYKASAGELKEEVISNQWLYGPMVGSTTVKEVRYTLAEDLPDPVIIIKRGSLFEFVDCEIDLSNLGDKTFMMIEEGGQVYFRNTRIYGANGSAQTAFILVDKGRLKILDGSLFENNHNTYTANSYADYQGGSIIRVENGELIVGDNVHFLNNSVKGALSPISLFDSTVEFGENLTFEKNRGGSIGGGVIFAHNTDLAIGNAEFIDNAANFGGAIWFDGNNLSLNGTIFEKNSSEVYGGAIFANKGYSAYLDDYIREKMNITLENVRFVDNAALNSGGGLANGLSGELVMKDRNAAVIFGNHAGLSDDFQDVYIMNAEIASTFSEKMFIGGNHHWAYSDPVQAVCLGMPHFDFWGDVYPYQFQYDVSGYYAGSNPDNQNIDNIQNFDEYVLISGNSAHSSLSEDETIKFWNDDVNFLTTPVSFRGNGGGIANNGKLILGEDAAAPVSLTKVWEGDEELKTEIRPGYKEFLESLTFQSGDFVLRPTELVLLGEHGEENREISLYYDPKDPNAVFAIEAPRENEYFVTIDGLSTEADTENFSITEAHNGYYNSEFEKAGDSRYTIVNRWNGKTPMDPDDRNFLDFYLLSAEESVLPRTGFSGIHPQLLAEQPKDISYRTTGALLEIPSLSVSAEIVTVPFADGEFPVEWLGESVGLLEGSSRPGEGFAIITGHNHLNNTEVGPFAMLQYMNEGDKFFVLTARQQMLSFTVYANEKIAEDDITGLAAIAERHPGSLILITCEDERLEGGYASRRVISAKSGN